MNRLIEACDRGLVYLDVDAQSLEEALRQIVANLVTSGALGEADAPAVLEALLERERDSTTAIGQSLAVPHAYLEGVREPMIAFARLKRGIQCGAPD